MIIVIAIVIVFMVIKYTQAWRTTYRVSTIPFMKVLEERGYVCEINQGFGIINSYNKASRNTILITLINNTEKTELLEVHISSGFKHLNVDYQSIYFPSNKSFEEREFLNGLATNLSGLLEIVE